MIDCGVFPGQVRNTRRKHLGPALHFHGFPLVKVTGNSMNFGVVLLGKRQKLGLTCAWDSGSQDRKEALLLCKVMIESRAPHLGRG